MLNFIFRLLLTFNATSLILVVYAVKERYVLSCLFPKLDFLPDFVSYLVYFLIPIILTFISLIVANGLDSDSIEFEKEEDKERGINSPIKEIEQANNAFLPSYLGYFFVALSVPYCDTLIFVFGILFIFTFLSQTLYFNPLFLFFGYHFYYLTTDNNIRIFIITRQKLKDPKKESFSKLKRINNFTFIDKEK
ncbi:MAG: hypothetical protein DRJ01_04670 [Bacteroidetes bacterium]|nr:MAG: hypothetical protein DRJ01_04670 [Bacteroidota bacterium]